jgi:peptide methionine sulfoxide reductase msrA/msrB
MWQRLWVLTMAVLALGSAAGSEPMTNDSTAHNPLTPEEERVLLHKGTEAPFSGEFDDLFEAGSYYCRRCDARLYEAADKFRSHCGWPSFDDEIEGAVRRQADADGSRVEILCNACGAHLGHVFEGEGLTAKNVRHCVNSISMSFVPAAQPDTARAYFAGGCFWGVEHLLAQQPGVLSAASGYMGGTVDHPTYQQVCTGTTGHLEVVEVTYDPAVVDFETLARLFFEIHDPTQADGQGPDLGAQYRSAIFCHDAAERQVVRRLIGLLQAKGYGVVTQILPVAPFWPAEDYHQDYYALNGKRPYCHVYAPKF